MKLLALSWGLAVLAAYAKSGVETHSEFASGILGAENRFRIRCADHSPESLKVQQVSREFLNQAREFVQNRPSSNKSSRSAREVVLIKKRAEMEKLAARYDLTSCLGSAGVVQEICALSHFEKIRREKDGTLVLEDPFLAPGVRFEKRISTAKGALGPQYQQSWVIIDQKSGQSIGLMADRNRGDLSDGKLSQAVVFKKTVSYEENKKDYSTLVVYEENEGLQAKTLAIDGRIGAFSAESSCFDEQGDPADAMAALVATGQWTPRDSLLLNNWSSVYNSLQEGSLIGLRGTAEGIKDVGRSTRDTAAFLWRASVFLNRLQRDPKAWAQVHQALKAGYGAAAPHFKACWEANPLTLQFCMQKKIGKAAWNKITQVVGQCFSEASGEALSRCLGATSAIIASVAVSGGGSTAMLGLRAQSFGLRGAAVELGKSLGGTAPTLARAASYGAVASEVIINQSPIDPDMLASRSAKTLTHARERVISGSRKIASVDEAARRSSLSPHERSTEIGKLLERPMNPKLEKRIQEIHEVGHRPGEVGKDGNVAGFYFDKKTGELRSNYKAEQIAEKRRLAEGFFSKAEMDQLLDQGYLGRRMSTEFPSGSRQTFFPKLNHDYRVPDAATARVSLFEDSLPAIARKGEKSFRAEAVYDYERLKPSVKIHDLDSLGFSRAEPLADGTYVFAVTADGRVAYANRVLPPESSSLHASMAAKPDLEQISSEAVEVVRDGFDAFGNPVKVTKTLHTGASYLKDDATFLVTHDSLAIALSGGKKEPVPFISAGEFVVRNGRIPRLTNFSGTYPSGLEHLKLGEAELKNIGLPLHKETEILDVSKDAKIVGGGHATAAQQAYAEAVIANDPHLKSIYDETIVALKEAEEAGLTTGNQLKHLWSMTPNDTYFPVFAVSLFQYWKNPVESMPERVLSLLSRMRDGEKGYRESIELIRKASAKKLGKSIELATEPGARKLFGGDSIPSVIQRNASKGFAAQMIRDPERIRAAVKTVDLSSTSAANALKNLPDGNYIYAITDDARLAVGPRALPPPKDKIKIGALGKIDETAEALSKSGKKVTSQGKDLFGNSVEVVKVEYASMPLFKEDAEYLLTHDALAMVLKNPDGSLPKFVAPGEFAVRGGKVKLINNKAGTYPGSGDALPFAEKRFKEAGLQIADDVRMKNYAEKDLREMGHAEASHQAYAEANVAADPKLKSLYDDTMKVLREYSDSKMKPDELFDYLEDSENAAGFALRSSSWWKNPEEGLAERFLMSLRGVGSEEELRSHLRKISEAIRKKNMGIPPPMPVAAAAAAAF